jgi:hypothetical protein
MPDGMTFSATGTSLADSTALLAGHAYVYRVRAVDTQGISSVQSAPDLTTRIVFSDDALVEGVSLIRGVHVSQLRQAIDAVRAAAGLAPAWSNYNPPTGSIFAATFTELRSRLNEARTNLQLSEVNFTASVVPGQLVRASSVRELRTGVK